MPTQLRRAFHSARYHPKTTLGAALALAGMLLSLHHAGWDPRVVRVEEFLAALATVVLGIYASDSDQGRCDPVGPWLPGPGLNKSREHPNFNNPRDTP